MVPKTCSIPECGKPIRARGICTGHYAQRSRGKEFTPLTGSALTVGMSTEERFWFYVEKSEGCWEYIGGKNADGYGSFSLGGISMEAHRVAWEFTNGSIPDGIQIDHRCHNKSCVNTAHLRFATNQQNQQNLRRPPITNTSGALGVYWNREIKRWYATVKHSGKTRYLGSFDSIDEASAAATEGRANLFTHFQGAAIREALGS